MPNCAPFPTLQAPKWVQIGSKLGIWSDKQGRCTSQHERGVYPRLVLYLPISRERHWDLQRGAARFPSDVVHGVKGVGVCQMPLKLKWVPGGFWVSHNANAVPMSPQWPEKVRSAFSMRFKMGQRAFRPERPPRPGKSTFWCF